MNSTDALQDAGIFSDAYKKPHVSVPIVRATPESLTGYGTLVPNFHAEDIIRVTWPKLNGWRPVVSDTGNLQLPAEDDFRVRWVGDIMYYDNFGALFTIGYPAARCTSDGLRDHVLVREVNYHPDGSQIIFPTTEGRPYIMLLARADTGDDVRPEHFQAFYFDGSFGFHISPGVWHFTPYIKPPSGSGKKAEMVFNNKQSSVLACVAADIVEEFGVYLKVPLKLDG